MGARGTGNKLPRHAGICRNQRSHQAAATRPRQLHGVFGVTAGHQGCDGAKGFGGVDGRGFVRLRAEQQGGREECASRLQIGFTTQTDLAARGKEMIDFFLHVSTLLTVDEGPHLHPFLGRIADDHFLQPRNQRLADGVNLRFRHDDAADGGTFLSGFGGHLAHHFSDKQRKLRVFRRHVLTQHAAVERICFHGKRNGMRDDIRVDAQTLPGAGRSGKRHHVLAVELVQQIARATADQADGAVGHQSALDDRFHHRLSHLRGGGGGLDDGGHPGKPGGRELFQHPPAREVERVDMHRHAGFRR